MRPSGGKSRREIWEDEPDVEWTCVRYNGAALFVIQATGPHLSAALLLPEYKTVEVRDLYDNSKLPALVAEHFILFADGNITAPVLRTDPDALQLPLREAVEKGDPWLFIIQVVVEGQQVRAMYQVGPDGTAVSMSKDGSLFPGWIVGIR